MPIEFNYQGHVGALKGRATVNVPSRLNVVIRGGEAFRQDLEKALEGIQAPQLENFKDKIRAIQAEASDLIRASAVPSGMNPASQKP
jgi:hypothetical protein